MYPVSFLWYTGSGPGLVTTYTYEDQWERIMEGPGVPARSFTWDNGVTFDAGLRRHVLQEWSVQMSHEEMHVLVDGREQYTVAKIPGRVAGLGRLVAGYRIRPWGADAGTADTGRANSLNSLGRQLARLTGMEPVRPVEVSF